MKIEILKNKMSLNKKGLGFIIMYTGIFVFAMILLFISINKFKITTERATLFQAVDSAARMVADQQYTISSTSLEKSGTFTVNNNKNKAIVTKCLSDLGLRGYVTVNSAIFNSSQAKVVVSCTYNYQTNYLTLTTNGIVKRPYTHSLAIKGIAYLKSVEFKY